MRILREIISTTGLTNPSGKTGQWTHSGKTERLGGDRKVKSICLGPKRVAKVEGAAIARDESRARPQSPGKQLVQSFDS